MKKRNQAIRLELEYDAIHFVALVSIRSGTERQGRVWICEHPKCSCRDREHLAHLRRVFAMLKLVGENAENERFDLRDSLVL